MQRDNPLYESQEIRMEMFADVTDDDDDGNAPGNSVPGWGQAIGFLGGARNVC